MNRFLCGILANACVVAFGYLVLVTVPVGSWEAVAPLRTQMAASGLLGAAAVAAAFVHVALTSSAALGPVAAVLGACAVTTLCNALLFLPTVAQLSSTQVSLTMIATASTGALLGGSLGVLRRC